MSIWKKSANHDTTTRDEAPGRGGPATEGTAEAAIVTWLSQKPEVVIPEGFAHRVQRHVFAQPSPRRVRLPGWGARLMAVSAGVLTAGMFALAPHAAPSLSNVAFDGEMILLLELGGLLLCSSYLLVRE